MATPRSAATSPPPAANATGLDTARHGSSVGAVRVLRRLPSTVLLVLLRGYQLIISPWTAPSCRYYPSCSQYAVIAVQRHGALRGGWLAIRRLGRCHPWTPGGVDDVPPVRDEKTSAHGRGPSAARSTTK